MDLVTLSELAGMLGLPPSDTERLTHRVDFPSPCLSLPEYIYWRRTEVERWLSDLKLSPDELATLVSLTRPDSVEESREHFYLTQNEIEETDDAELLSEWFTLETDLLPEDENDEAALWLEQHEQSNY